MSNLHWHWNYLAVIVPVVVISAVVWLDQWLVARARRRGELHKLVYWRKP